MTLRLPSRTLAPSLFALCLLVLQPDPVAAHDQHAHDAGTKAAAPPPSAVRLRLDDVTLRDQDGRELGLLSDVLGSRVAVVNFVYTTCTTTCPVASATVAELQRRLGPRVGSEVMLVTITTDPARDTPARMKQTAARFGAGSGWLWLGGRKDDVDRVLKAFGAYTPNPEDHPPLTLVGHAASGRWTRLYGFAGADEVLSHVERSAAVASARRP